MTLLPVKAIYFEKHKTLLVSDIHLGRIGHFKNSPVALADGLAETDMVMLNRIISTFDVSEIFILGEIFPRKENYDYRLFKTWRDLHQNIDVNLIKESTEMMSDEIYTNFEIRIHRKYYLWNKFLFTHKPLVKDVKLTGCEYVFSGYINPGININGKGRTLQNLPCYYFDANQCILPAFGEPNRKSLMKPSPKDRVYAISVAENEHIVLKVDKT